jgi:PAS domain S-box-containing protein
MDKLRLPQVNHAIRTAAFAWCFFLFGLLFLDRGLATLAGTALNNAVLRGWRGAGLAVACYALGALAWVAPTDFVLQPATGQLVTTLCLLGSLAYSCGVGLVVFERNRSLREARVLLRESEQRYRLIAEHAGDLVAMVDRNGRFLYASPSCARFLGPEDTAAGADAFRNLHEEDQFRVRGALQVVVRGGESCRLRFRLHTAAGEVRRFEAMVHPVRGPGQGVGGDTGGNGTAETAPITGAVLAARDVTELREREEQVEIAAHAFECMAEGMAITNAAGRLLSVNQAYTRITGYPPEAVLGRPESELRSALQPQSFYDAMYAEVLRKGRWEGISWCRRRDGTAYREWRSLSAVRDPDGRVTHFVALFRELDGRDEGGGDSRAARLA